MDAREYLQLKERVESLQRKADKAAGALEQIKERIRSEFGAKTLQEAKQLLEKMEEQEEQLEKKLAKATKEFESKWNDRIR